MRSRFVAAAFVGVLSIAAVQPSGAFGLSGVGFRGGVVDPEDIDGTISIGGHLEFEQRGTRLHLLPNVSYWNSDNVTDINPNFDLYYHFGPAGSVTPYLGAGLGLHFLSVDVSRFVSADETNAGLNLMGGVLFPGRTARFFVEGRLALTEVDTSSILGGVTFLVGQ